MVIPDSVITRVDYSYGGLVRFNVTVKDLRRSMGLLWSFFKKIEICLQDDEGCERNAVVPVCMVLRNVFKVPKDKDSLNLFLALEDSSVVMLLYRKKVTENTKTVYGDVTASSICN